MEGPNQLNTMYSIQNRWIWCENFAKFVISSKVNNFVPISSWNILNTSTDMYYSSSLHFRGLFSWESSFGGTKSTQYNVFNRESVDMMWKCREHFAKCVISSKINNFVPISSWNILNTSRSMHSSRFLHFRGLSSLENSFGDTKSNQIQPNRTLNFLKSRILLGRYWVDLVPPKLFSQRKDPGNGEISKSRCP